MRRSVDRAHTIMKSEIERRRPARNERAWPCSVIKALRVLTRHGEGANNTLAKANGGPSLVSYGGTLSHGYTFGVQQGLSLSGTGAFDAYSIDIHFYFDDVSASFNGFQRIIDFKNRTSDSGLYSFNGFVESFAAGGSGDGSGASTNRVFSDGVLVDLLVQRDRSGLFSVSVNGNLAYSRPRLVNSIFRTQQHHVLFYRLAALSA